MICQWSAGHPQIMGDFQQNIIWWSPVGALQIAGRSSTDQQYTNPKSASYLQITYRWSIGYIFVFTVSGLCMLVNLKIVSRWPVDACRIILNPALKTADDLQVTYSLPADYLWIHSLKICRWLAGNLRIKKNLFQDINSPPNPQILIICGWPVNLWLKH